ncbi:MAG TPA: restriction endonuclease subunit S [Verrucomicrobiae bacterium]|nr:restriction endonuclease subunit S [Verrucomicrobiae bacterium]
MSWPTKKLGEIAKEIRSGFACAKTKRVEDGVIHLRTNNISLDGRLDLSTITKIPKRFVDEKADSLKKNDILFNNTNSVELVGKTLLVDSDLPYAFSNHLTRIRVDEKVAMPKYVVLMFWKFWQEGLFARLCTQWVNQAGINQTKLEAIKIPLPPLDEQKRIISKIEKLFVKLDEAGRLRAEALSASAALLPSALHDVFGRAGREGWEEIKLIDICEKTKLVQPEKISKGSFNYIDITSVSEMDGIGAITARVLPVKEAPSRARKLVREGDTIFATTRPYLKRIAFIPKDLSNSIASTGFCVLRPKEGIADSSYVFHIVNSDNFVSKIIPLQRGASYPAVSDKDVLSQTIPLPTFAEQRKIVEYLDALSAKTRELQSLQEATANEFVVLRQSILAHELGSS